MNEHNLSTIDEEMDIQLNQDQLNDDQISIVKYTKLLKKCEQIRMENFRLINYIDQINKLVRKVRKQNAFIANKLDQNNDDYHKNKPSILHEIELVINYGKNKLTKKEISPSSKIKYTSKQLNLLNDNETQIDHKNKRIKIEQSFDGLNVYSNDLNKINQTSSNSIKYQ